MIAIRSFFRRTLRHPLLLLLTAVITATLIMSATGCKKNRGTWLNEPTDFDEQPKLLREVRLTSHASAHPRKVFDHDLDETIHLGFIPAGPTKEHESKTVWFDSLGKEFRTIRRSHKKGESAFDPTEKPGTHPPRTHTMSVKEMWKHRPGVWSVELYLDDKLARRLRFSVR